MKGKEIKGKGHPVYRLLRLNERKGNEREAEAEAEQFLS